MKLVDKRPFRIRRPDETIQYGDWMSAAENQGSLTEREWLNQIGSDKGGWMRAEWHDAGRKVSDFNRSNLVIVQTEF